MGGIGTYRFSDWGYNSTAVGVTSSLPTPSLPAAASSDIDIYFGGGPPKRKRTRRGLSRPHGLGMSGPAPQDHYMRGLSCTCLPPYAAVHPHTPLATKKKQIIKLNFPSKETKQRNPCSVPYYDCHGIECGRGIEYGLQAEALENGDQTRSSFACLRQ